MEPCAQNPRSVSWNVVAAAVWTRWMRQLLSPVFFSTSENGEIARGLSNIPTDRPIMLIGYHMFLGVDLGILIGEFMKEKSCLIRGLAHPILVGKNYEGDKQPDPAQGDAARLFGAVPVSGRSMFKLLKNGDSTVLFPGGAREALHRKVCCQGCFSCFLMPV